MCIVDTKKESWFTLGKFCKSMPCLDIVKMFFILFTGAVYEVVEVLGVQPEMFVIVVLLGCFFVDNSEEPLFNVCLFLC